MFIMSAKWRMARSPCSMSEARLNGVSRYDIALLPCFGGRKYCPPVVRADGVAVGAPPGVRPWNDTIGNANPVLAVGHGGRDAVAETGDAAGCRSARSPLGPCRGRGPSRLGCVSPSRENRA